jgi:5-methylcytosine-specific restriction endonuclease McrA
MATGYPDNWAEIANEIKQRAGGFCEHCGHIHDPGSGYTLTVHHLDGNPANCAYENLVALCQRCHLHIQARYVPGQLSFVRFEWMERRGL